jgi:signal transduction histidine kinase
MAYTVPLDTLDALVEYARELVETSRVSTQDDFSRVLESAQKLRERLTAVSGQDVPRGSDEFIHHLRSPLNLVMAYTTVILDEADSALTERHVALLHMIEHDAELIGEFITACCE